MTKNNVFWMQVQATEGDFTQKQKTLQNVASDLAYSWVNYKKNPNDWQVRNQACQKYGFDYDSLLYEEKQYLLTETGRMVSSYATYKS